MTAETSTSDLAPDLFAGVTVSPDGGLIQDKDVQHFEAGLAVTGQLISAAMPLPAIDLTAEEAVVVNRNQYARLLLDSAALAPMVCSSGCYFIAQCPLAQIQKHPIGFRCPFEQQYVVERFISWMREFGRTADTLLESERTQIADLVSFQVELLRCRAILAMPEHAHLQQRSVRDVDANTGAPIAWEDQVHIAAQREDQIILQMRMIMRDFELTPEMKTRRQKALQLRSGADLASRQSSIYDKLRAHQKAAAPIIDVDS